MNNLEIDDNELIYLLSENDENVKNLIYEKYGYIIDIIIKKYAKFIHVFQIDETELRQEASYGFSDGINSYSQSNGASLKTFLTLCISRRVNNYLDKYTSKKAKIIKDTLSLESSIRDTDTPLVEVISDDEKYDPLNDLTSTETVEEILSVAKENLSLNEYQVFMYLVNGLNYKEIANILGKSLKQVDNTIQRIKIKLRKILTIS